MTPDEAELLVLCEPKLVAAILVKTSDALWSWSQNQHDDLDRELNELYPLLWK